MRRNNKNMKWHKCEKCGGRVYKHRPESHECGIKLSIQVDPNLKRWTCPRCEREVEGYPALSRKDNKTEICTNCGQEEAMNDFLKAKKKTKKLVCKHCKTAVDELYGLFEPHACKPCMKKIRQECIETGDICLMCKKPRCDCYC